MFSGKQICHIMISTQNGLHIMISIQEYRILLKLILVEMSNVKIKYIPELSATETVDNKVDG